MPVSGINFLGINFLLVFIGLICDVKDFINQTRAKYRVCLKLCIFLVLSHFTISKNLFFYDMMGLMLMYSQQLNFFAFCNFFVKLFTFNVLVFSKVSVLNNYILALLSTPDFILKLFFLGSLMFH